MSPEVAANKPYTHKTDIWAVGVVLYEMYKGRGFMDGMRESEKYGFLSKERDWGRGWQQGELGLGGCGVEIGEFFGRVLVPEESRW